jgi:exonuclease SbcD
MKILVSGDWHVDASKIGRTNPDTDLDYRTEDFLKAVDFMIDYAVKNKVDVFIMNGDLFKGRTSTHHLETIIAEKFQAIASKMRLIINLGNHDYTPKQLAYGIHTYSVLQKYNVEIYTEITHLTLDDCDLVLYPYYDLKRVAFESNEKLINWVQDTVLGFELNKPCKLFVGHGTPKGTIINEDWYFDLEMIDEPVLPHNILEPFDMALFSHIHRRHEISRHIWHIGSPERIDFSEATEDKGFVVFNTVTKKPEWISTNPRPMAVLDINLLKISEFDDPTEYIINQIISIPDLDQTMMKITVECSLQTMMKIDQVQIKTVLGRAFFYKPPTYDSPRIQKSRNKAVTEQLSVPEAVEKVVNSKENLSPEDKKQILIKARAILAGPDEGTI